MTEKISKTKVLSIENGDETKTQKNVAFIQRIENEKSSAKLYYYMWLSRLFIFFAIVSLSIFMSLSLSLFKLAPLVFVEPLVIIGQDRTENIVRAEAITPNMTSREKMLEIFMRQYVILRNTFIPDATEMMTRWNPGGMIHFLSSNYMFLEFEPEAKKTTMELLNKGISRSVVIDSIRRVGGKKSPVWRVDFRTFDIDPNDKEEKAGSFRLKVKHWTASINAGFYSSRIFTGRRLINPLGFTVIDYSQAAVNVF